MENKIWDSVGSNSKQQKYPAEILMRYAQKLTSDTDGRIEGVVTETSIPTKHAQGFEYDRMVFALYLVVPYLKNTSYRLIEVEHLTFAPYPVNIKLFGQVSPNVISVDNIQDENDFQLTLEELIKNNLTKMLIGHIYTMIDIKKTA